MNHITAVLWAPTGPQPTSPRVMESLRDQGNVRIILRARDPSGLAEGAEAQRVGLPIHVILDAGQTPPSWAADRIVTIPAQEQEQGDALALALSDAVIDLDDERCDASTAEALVESARKLGKHVISYKNPASLILPVPFGADALECGLDPDSGWRRIASRWIGRTEVIFSELFVVQNCKKNLKNLRRCLGWDWTVKSYFAPEMEHADWRMLCPDTAQTAEASLSVCFNRLDRRAKFGASAHRDVIWLGHLLAAAAVFAAVAGTLDPVQEKGWGAAEFLLLVLIGGITFASIKLRVQKRWMAYRLATEQLRIARMCVPLLVVPPLLMSTDYTTKQGVIAGADDADGDNEVERVVKRAIRDHGLPRFINSLEYGSASEWLKLIVNDQANYHKRNVETLERVETRLHAVAAATFFLALGAVILHLIEGLPTVQICIAILIGVAGVGVGAVKLIRCCRWKPLPLASDHIKHEELWRIGIRIMAASAGGALLFFLFRAHALLLVTAAGPALAAAFHGISTRLGLTNRIAESRTAWVDLNNVLTELASTAPGEELPLNNVRALAQRATRAMNAETRRWHGLLRRQFDILP